MIRRLALRHWILLGAACLPAAGAFAAPPASLLPASVRVELRLPDGRQLSARADAPRFGSTGVTLEIRTVPTAHGARFDIRVRNRGREKVEHTGLSVRIPRAGNDAFAVIEAARVPIPAELRQFWRPAPGLEGAKYGFSYEVISGSRRVTRAGPSTNEREWGARASGIVRADGRAYAIPEFWERQPRRISVTRDEIVFWLFDGSLGFAGPEGDDSTRAALRAGEDVWDRFAVIEDARLGDSVVAAEAEGLPDLQPAARADLMRRFGIAPEGLQGRDQESARWLRKYDRWQGVSWEAHYADPNPARPYASGGTGRTTLFTLFENGGTFPVNSPGTYSWRNYGDIQWGGGMSAAHYDWVRAAFKHYLRTANRDALRWAMAAMRHAVSVDFQWNEAFQPGDAGFARYEKGSHGLDDFPGRPSHTWGEGLFLAHAITADPWTREAAVRRADGAWNYFGGASRFVWDGAFGEIRWLTWPLLLQVRAFRETRDEKYWTKARQLMDEVLRAEQLSGAAGYIANYAYATLQVGYPDMVSSLQMGYSVRGILEFADLARSRREWSPRDHDFLLRFGRWAASPMPNGPYVPPGPTRRAGGFFGDGWCAPARAPTVCDRAEARELAPQPLLNVLYADLFAWLAREDPRQWTAVARAVFRDAVNAANHPEGIVGYLTDQYPNAESKVMGRMQLFGDRAALWLATPAPP
jgi:hypothetical protein